MKATMMNKKEKLDIENFSITFLQNSSKSSDPLDQKFPRSPSPPTGMSVHSSRFFGEIKNFYSLQEKDIHQDNVTVNSSSYFAIKLQNNRAHLLIRVLYFGELIIPVQFGLKGKKKSGL